jgi:zinc/manganese transport system substrate-binding protein
MSSRDRRRRGLRNGPRLGAVVLTALALTIAGCGEAAEPDAAPDATPDNTPDAEPDVESDAAEPDASATASDLLVVATTSILGDITEQLVGDDGRVEVVMPPGADPHGFQPSASDAAMLREADLVVANGLDLEESLLSALEAAEDEGVRILELAPALDPIEFGEGLEAHEGEDDGHGPEDDGHDDEGGDDHDHGPEDPHVWFDPVRMADGVRLLGVELAQVADHPDDEEWERRAEDYAEQVLAVHEELGEAFGAIPADRRKLVTNHDALGYLAYRYDFEVLGTVIPGSSTQAEADARQFSQLIQTVEEAGVHVIFAENTDSTVLAEQLASEVLGRADLEVEVVELYTDALGEPGSGAESYLDLLRSTAQRIVTALR